MRQLHLKSRKIIYVSIINTELFRAFQKFSFHPYSPIPTCLTSFFEPTTKLKFTCRQKKFLEFLNSLQILDRFWTGRLLKKSLKLAYFTNYFEIIFQRYVQAVFIKEKCWNLVRRYRWIVKFNFQAGKEKISVLITIEYGTNNLFCFPGKKYFYLWNLCFSLQKFYKKYLFIFF